MDVEAGVCHHQPSLPLLFLPLPALPQLPRTTLSCQVNRGGAVGDPDWWVVVSTVQSPLIYSAS